MNLVFIEDEDLLRKSLAYFLRSHGHEVMEFDNGADAIVYIHKNHENIDLIITDLNLPFAGGKQVLHSSNPYKRIKKIVLTSYSMESNELEVFDLGGDDFIAKPFSPQVLLKRIDKLFSSM
ncbi:response regulator [uncultured Fluviicola sp.]|jgi:two-component system response regulator Irr|uniref:response regulator n=1 Tax=uncultured Fluviicola sp. TaxID=463303 RepID=UPI0025D55283|nr:response regulator [uncultured Fluviicola sp.]